MENMQKSLVQSKETKQTQWRIGMFLWGIGIIVHLWQISSRVAMVKLISSGEYVKVLGTLKMKGLIDQVGRILQSSIITSSECCTCWQLKSPTGWEEIPWWLDCLGRLPCVTAFTWFCFSFLFFVLFFLYFRDSQESVFLLFFVCQTA